MKLPVSRERYNADVDRWRTAAEQATEKLRGDAERWQREKDALVTEAQKALQQTTEYWQTRYDTLLDKYHELAQPKVAEKEVPGVPAERVTSPVTDAIRAESGGNPRLAQYLSRRAAELRRENPKASAEDIAGMLQSWSSTEDDGNEAAA
jgi:FtsZ-binding cell division protein ZapB